MRLTAIIPLLCLIGALILSILCIFAGSKQAFMEDYNILTVNTSRIGFEYFNSSTSSSHSSHGSWLSPLSNWFSTETHHFEQTLEDDLNNDLRSLAADLGLRDFYSIHVLDFCEGFYRPAGSSAESVTHCSKTTGLFTFNLTRTLQNGLADADIHITLSDIHWPAAIDDGLDALAAVFNAMFVLYCIGAACAGLALLTTAAALFLNGRASAMLNVIVAFLAALALLIASVLVTYGASKAVDVVNDYGADVNVNAARGDRFLGLTWGATALVLTALVAWVVELCAGRRRERRLGLKSHARKEVE